MEKTGSVKPPVLSEKDREILFRLSLNGRISLTTLGQQVNLSKQAVSYRVKQMEEEAIIKKYYAITNIYRLGKTHYRVFIKYHHMNSDTEKELREYLIRHPRIAWVLYLAGDFDLFFVVWADHIIQFEEVYDAIMGKFGSHFQEKYFSIATRIEYLPYDFLLENREVPGQPKSFVFGNGFGEYLPDELEKQILTILNHNGRMYFTEMAQQLGVTSRIIKNKINDLIKHRIIIGFNVKIDHNLLGYTYQKTLLKLNDTSRAELGRLSAYLKKQPSVIYLLKTIGTYDFEFEMMTRSPEEYYNLVKDLRLEFAHNIKDHSMVIMSEEPKYEYLEL
jgi:Lrp/AsnC family transcriptional regulator, leucine-responsive regulatory protein